MSRHNPGFEDRVRAFAARLEECRKAHGLTQDEMAGELDISRKTYVFLETGRWVPHPRERHHMIHTLHKLDPAAAEAYAAMYELPVSYWGIAPVAVAAPKPLDAQQARHAYTAALYDAAEEAELPANLLRPFVAAVLAALRESGMSLEQAAEVAKEVAKRKPARTPRAARDEGPRFRVEASDAAREADGAERETQGRRKR